MCVTQDGLSISAEMYEREFYCVVVRRAYSKTVRIVCVSSSVVTAVVRPREIRYRGTVYGRPYLGVCVCVWGGEETFEKSF